MIADAARAAVAIGVAASILWAAFVVWFMASSALSLRRIAEAADLWRQEKEVEIETDEG